MKKTCVVLGLALLPALTWAQGFPGGGEADPARQQQHIQHLASELNLNAEQTQRVQQLFQQQGEKFKAIHQETEAGLQQILTPAQFSQWQAQQQQRREHWQQGGRNGGNPPAN
jgi:Spy/CpxP family protein refolding chaperone